MFLAFTLIEVEVELAAASASRALLMAASMKGVVLPADGFFKDVYCREIEAFQGGHAAAGDDLDVFGAGAKGYEVQEET